MTIQKFSEYKDSEKLNEEFIGGLIKGALGKLFNVFSAPFKDMANDFKKMFKEDDFGTLKDIVMTNFNQAIDAAQKEIPKVQTDGDLTNIMPTMIGQLVQLANNIGKDVTQGLGKDKTTQVTAAARAVILGNKEAKWQGLVGYLDPTNKEALKNNGGLQVKYNFSKTKYDEALTNAGKKGGDALKAKRDAASKFFDGLQKDVANFLEKELTDEEIKNIYDKSGKGGGADEMTYDKVKDFYDKKIPVIYLLKDKTKADYDPKKKPEEQTDVVGVKIINAINDQNKDDSVTFLNKDNNPTIKKSYADIIGPGEEQKGENAKKTADILGRIKDDEEKMGNVAKFAEFVEKDPTKAAEIIKNIGQ